ncbi:CorA metal ion transporter [Mucor velutinosus]|uniref:CorA metal ion transporter n=1 Tax=Mucor velutinosus TaxID=708070 RepID=A0AAN7D4J1_9FUNG|nr:CorA metal ion transporter [Mucor velutinosus]
MSDNSSVDSDMSNTEQELVFMLNTFMKGRKPQHPVKQIPHTVIIEEDVTNNSSSALSTSFSTLAIDNQAKDIPNEIKVRSKRAVEEHIRLLSSDMIRYLRKHEFKVRGTTGKVYTVIIGNRLECTCRDYQIRKCHCKHILYILLKELKIRDLSMEIFKTLYPSDEILKEVFQKYHTLP